MKKHFLVSLLLVSCFLISCNSPYDTFTTAMEKTDQIEKAKTLVTVEMKMQGNSKKEELLMPEKVTIHHMYDRSKEQAKSSVYATVNSVGFDMTIFSEGNNMIVTSPLLPKLLVLQHDHLKEEMFDQSNFIDFSTEQEVVHLWSVLLTDENVSRIGNVIVTTPDGDVKGKEFEITLNEAQLKPAIIETLSIYLANPKLVPFLAPNELEEMKETMVEHLSKSEIGPFSYYASIDRDAYLVEERVALTLKLSNDVTIEMDVLLQRYDIGKEMMIEIPEITDKNMMTLDDFLDGELSIVPSTK